MPAAWPEQPHSQLQQQEARWHQHWLAQQAPSRSRWFAMNPTPSPGWMRPRSSPPSLPSAAASPVSQPGSHHVAPHQQDPGAAAGPSAPAGPAPEADQAADGPAGVSPLDRRRAWQRLWDCPASNRAKALAWRLHHGRLPCGVYLASKGQPQRAHCPAPSCSVDGSLHVASLTHVFLECGAYTAARVWLAELWAAVSGAVDLPFSQPAVLLGDWPGGWPAYPTSPGLQLLWAALRATWLWAVWGHYHRAEPDDHPSATVVGCVIGELQRLMRAHFSMAALSEDTLAGLPRGHITAQLKPGRLDAFEASWAHEGVLCSVQRVAGSSPRLQVHLSRVAPVPAPQAPAGGAQAAQQVSPTGSASAPSPARQQLS
ncbi:hypothetical protein PLESTB_000337700 [Pleodorina starrii]|uniref:Uncharacterized protein n=1 Tax=Pleodorina starrii TaxID=330485 RepID=A0A9W6BDK8_9CHLO|nr:hypothetical protein PLESTB_000337700 [Pleodorina starrii]GLC70375.1 hypothetical protein PLESTF_000966300 [Pleodorina starrii]